MISRRTRLARWCQRLGLLSLLLGRHRQRLPILAYHRILDNDTPVGTLADPGLFSATAGAFQQHMEFIAHHFNTVTFTDLLTSDALPPNPIVISFDDGFEDNYRLAFPVLKALNLSAVFFVTTDFIDAREPLWFDLVSRILARVQGTTSLRIGEQDFRTDAVPAHQLVAQVLSHLKALPGPQRREAIAALQRQLRPADKADIGSPMNWEQLREMARAGMEIGSHSCSHTLLAGESTETVTAELVQSRERIETMLGRRCSSLAYPVGGHRAVNEQVLRLAREAGYRFACTYISGVNSLPPQNPMALRRLHVEQDMDMALFRAQLACPRLFGYGRS